MERSQYILLILLFMYHLFYITCSTSIQEESDMDLQPFVKLNWFAAVHFCRSYDSDLLTIESKAEKEALFTYLKEIFIFLCAWTSSNDLAEEGKYMSLNTGRPMLYKSWSANEPNNNEDAEHCVQAVLYDDRFEMNDNNCAKKMLVICEKRAPSHIRNAATKDMPNCEQVTTNCALKKLVDVYLQTTNTFSCQARNHGIYTYSTHTGGNFQPTCAWLIIYKRIISYTHTYRDMRLAQIHKWQQTRTLLNKVLSKS